MTTEKEHLVWCKQRALEYVDKGDLTGAFASFVSDMKKHSDTANHPALALGGMLFFGGHLRSPQQMREHIEGYN